MIGQLFSQLLGAGAAKSRADYNRQQKINQLLREGWVPKGEGGTPIESGGVIETEPSETEEDTTSLNNLNPEDIAKLDPRLAELVNEMLGVVSGGPLNKEPARADSMESLLSPERFEGDPPALDNVSGLMSQMDTFAHEDQGGLASPIEDTSGLAQGRALPAEQSDVFQGVHPYIANVDDTSVPHGLADSAAPTSKPSITPDGKRWVWSIDSSSWVLADAVPVADATRINPDPASRNWVNNKFKNIRSALDGFVPSGEEAGTFLKPIAEQLNSMFGKSTPLDMDGYEMGPYHAQRLEAKKLRQEDRHHQAEMPQRSRHTDVVENHYNNLDQNARLGMRQSFLEKVMEHHVDIAKLSNEALELANEQGEINPQGIMDIQEYQAWEARLEDLNNQLSAAMEDTWAQWGDWNLNPFGKDRTAILPYKFRFWDWGDPEEMSRVYNLMIGRDTQGNEIPDLPWFGRNIWEGDPAQVQRVERIVEQIDAINQLISRSPELQLKLATGERNLVGTSTTATQRGEARRAASGDTAKSLSDAEFKKAMAELLTELMQETQKKDPLKAKVE